jgi:hypothetical protein
MFVVFGLGYYGAAKVTKKRNGFTLPVFSYPDLITGRFPACGKNIKPNLQNNCQLLTT